MSACECVYMRQTDYPHAISDAGLIHMAGVWSTSPLKRATNPVLGFYLLVFGNLP